MEGQPDTRQAVYQELHTGQLTDDKQKSIYSAQYIFSRALDYFPIKSVLDVGCGLGTYLAVAQRMGMEIAGVEGPWCEVDKLDIAKDLVIITDLEQPIDLSRKFDLAISLEVGEHLSDAAAPHLVKTLTSHADHVVFSAAIPFQGGMHHVNEQFLGYWVGKFAAHGFMPIDIFRGYAWANPHVHVWLRQNLMLFARKDVVESNPKLQQESQVVRPMDVIHPYFYVDKVRDARTQLVALQLQLVQNGLARIIDTPEGQVFQLLKPDEA